MWFFDNVGLKMRSPKDAYAALWKAISGESVGVKVALSRLQGYFSDTTSKSSLRISTVKPSDLSESVPITVCVVDEIDFLMMKSDEIMDAIACETKVFTASTSEVRLVSSFDGVTPSMNAYDFVEIFAASSRRKSRATRSETNVCIRLCK